MGSVTIVSTGHIPHEKKLQSKCLTVQQVQAGVTSPKWKLFNVLKASSCLTWQHTIHCIVRLLPDKAPFIASPRYS